MSLPTPNQESPTSGRDDSGGPPYRKPRADVYTVMLCLALLAIGVGIFCLFFAMKDLPFPEGVVSAAARTAVAAASPLPTTIRCRLPITQEQGCSTVYFTTSVPIWR